MTVVTHPQSIKGLAVLSWTYLDPQKDQDVWLWLPSLRKIRRFSQAEADDSFLGSDWSTEEASTRLWEDETYRLVGEEKFPGFTSEYNGKTYHKDLDCWIIEATPKRKPWYYSRRIVWLDKRHGGDVYYEVYDPLGRKFKKFLKVHEIRPETRCVAEVYLEVYNLKTGHKSVVDLDDIRFNTGQNENFFSPRTLMRTKW